MATNPGETLITDLPVVASPGGGEWLMVDQSNGDGTFTSKRTTVGAVSATPLQASYITVAPSLPTANSRNLAVTAGDLVATDGGGLHNFTLSLATTAVTPTTYGDSTHVGQFTVDAKGRLTAASSVAITAGSIGSLAASSLVGNATGGPAPATAIAIGATFAFSGSTLQTGAGSGDVAWSANSYVTTIQALAVTTGKLAAAAVTYAKVQNVAASSLLGNPTGAPAAPSEITLGATLAFSGTSLRTAALTGDVTASANSFATTIAANAVTNAKMATMSANTVKANATGGSATPTDITLGSALGFSSSVLQVLNLTPSGRLTFLTATPVQTVGAAAVGTVFYTPYLAGNLVPLWDGTQFVMTTFAELSNVLANSAVGNAGPAAAVASQVYDLYVWSNSGTPTLTRSPTWASGGGSNTARGTGAGSAAQSLVKGIWVNTVAITNGPGAAAGTYIGTIATDGGGATVTFNLGSSAGGGGAATINLWNQYNRVQAPCYVSDSAASTAYTSATIRALNGSNTNRITFVNGQNEDGVTCTFSEIIQSGATAGASAAIMIGLDSTSAQASTSSQAVIFSPTAAVLEIGAVATYSGLPGLGVHFLQALQQGDGTHAGTYFGGALEALTASIRY